MPQSQNENGSVPSTIDMNTEIVWPDEMPPVPPLPEESESGAPTAADFRRWIQQLEEQERLFLKAKVKLLKARLWSLYNHLENSKIDWELEGMSGRCRVQGLPCYGQDFGEGLRSHLQTDEHLAYDASLALQTTASEHAPSTEQTADRQT